MPASYMPQASKGESSYDSFDSFSAVAEMRRFSPFDSGKKFNQVKINVVPRLVFAA